MKVIQFCADECKRQQSGEESVARMCEAWLYMADDNRKQTWIQTILDLSYIVEPSVNTGYRFRSQPVTIKDKVLPVIEFEHVVANITGWCATFQITEEEWYKEFEEIHPFNDGNGRIGSIMYNYLRGTMNEPETPPDYWN